MKFSDYNVAPEIKNNIEKAGFTKPTDIQYKSIPHILKGEDVLAIAQTGTGKTAAFVIPILDILKRKKIAKRSDGVKCLIMVPTHELAIQINEVFNKLGKNTKLKNFAIHGGVEQNPQIEKLQKGIDILIATPGRVFDLVHQGFLKLHRVEILVLDEADHMLTLGFLKDIQDLIKILPKKRQTLFFSATIDKKIKQLAYSLVINPIRIQISPKNPVAKNIEHSVAFIAMDDKRFFLERIIKENPESKILVFARTKVRAERILKAMERVDIKTITIHSDKTHEERSIAMQKFKSGEIKILIATDISARGIDIPNVDFVINYDLPEQSENYVHRVGRTGRGTQKGYAVSFCSKEENEILSEIEEYLEKPIEVLKIDKLSYQETIDFSEDGEKDWRKLLEEDEKIEKELKKKALSKKVKK